MNEQAFKDRTRQLGLRVIRAVESLPRTRTAEVVGRQLLRAGTAVGANYRAACRSRTRAEVMARLGVVEEETDETGYWLDLMVAAGLMPERKFRALIAETDEVLAMGVASIRVLRSGRAADPKSKIHNPKST